MFVVTAVDAFCKLNFKAILANIIKTVVYKEINDFWLDARLKRDQVLFLNKTLKTDLDIAFVYFDVETYWWTTQHARMGFTEQSSRTVSKASLFPVCKGMASK